MISIYRRKMKYICMHFIPSAMFVFVSWVSFLVPPHAVAGRMAMLVTLFLVLVNTFSSIQRHAGALRLVGFQIYLAFTDVSVCFPTAARCPIPAGYLPLPSGWYLASHSCSRPSSSTLISCGIRGTAYTGSTPTISRENPKKKVLRMRVRAGTWPHRAPQGSFNVWIEYL